MAILGVWSATSRQELHVKISWWQVLGRIDAFLDTVPGMLRAGALSNDTDAVVWFFLDQLVVSKMIEQWWKEILEQWWNILWKMMQNDRHMWSAGLSFRHWCFSTAEAKTEAEITQLADSLAQAPVSWRVPTTAIHKCWRNTSVFSVLSCCVANLTLAQMAPSLVSTHFLHVMIPICCE